MTCHIYRPNRSSHCHEKGRCVVKFDHWCPLLSSAIGIRNYKYYINALMILFILVSYLFGMGIFTVVKISHNGWMLTLLVYSAVMLTFISCLLGMHMAYVLNNVTTREGTPCRPLWALNHEKTPLPKPHIFVRCNVIDYWQNYTDVTPTMDFATLPPIIIDIVMDSRPWRQSIWQNWTSVMGESWWMWFLPLSPRLERAKWWECEFNEHTKALLRKKAVDKLLAFWMSTQAPEEPEKLHIKDKAEEDTIKLKHY